MTKKERINIIDQTLNQLYPDPQPALEFKTNYQLLVAVILSAQCTDERVNQVTQKLFADRPGPNAILDLGEQGLIGYIRSCGLFNSKAKNIMAMTRELVAQYKGEVPEDFEALVKLPGVGEKTAGVVMAQAFQQPAFPVDTHIHRLAHRLDLSRKKTPNQISADLKKLFPKDRWAELHLQIIFHGRRVCSARKPNCAACPLLPVCPEGKKRMKVTIGKKETIGKILS
ncbi:MAG: endonuclease III [Candidatus Altimarinota bacterium]